MKHLIVATVILLTCSCTSPMKNNEIRRVNITKVEVPMDNKKAEKLELWTKGKESNLIHIGYKNGNAILYETLGELILVVDEEDIFVLKKNQINPIFMNDRCEMYGHLLSEDYEVELKDEKFGIKKFLLKFYNKTFTEIYFPENRNKIYYHDIGREEICFYDLLKDEVVRTNFNGNTLNVTNNYMYYVKEIDSNTYMPDVDLYRVSLDKMDKDEVILKDTRESGVYVLPDDRYVYCEVQLMEKDTEMSYMT